MVHRLRMSAPRKKPGTKNPQEAKARDQLAARAARAAETVCAAADAAAAAAAAAVTPGADEDVVRRARPNTFEEEQLRRSLIVRRYTVLGSPPEHLWHGEGGTIKRIADWLELPATTDRRPIRRTLEWAVARVVAGA